MDQPATINPPDTETTSGGGPGAPSWLRARWRWVAAAIVVIVAVASAAAILRTGHTKQPKIVASTFESALLAGREGFAKAVTGGAGGPLVHVTSNADSGPGTLRAAAAGDSPAWIVFDHDMTIHLASRIDIGSNKTIDGRLHRVELTGHGQYGLRTMGVHNVIIANLTLHDFGDATSTDDNDKPDAIDIRAASTVWVYHCDLSMAGNKLIDIGKGAYAITVSWTHFHDQEQTFQIGDQATATEDAAMTVTVDHNYFDHTSYRNPVVSYGKVHVYNNYIVGWKVYGVRSQRVGQIYLEANVFQALGNKKGTNVVTGRKNGCNDAGTRCDNRTGYIDAIGNLAENGAVVLSNSPQLVFDPSKYYSYKAEAATPALATKLVAETGPQRGTDLPHS
ncbi:MAG: polysaccharide lyase family 1 protein [Actinomycetes bacterium]